MATKVATTASATDPWLPTEEDRAEIARQDAELAKRPQHGGHLPEDDESEASPVQETVFLGTVRKWNTLGTMVSVIHDNPPKRDATWYRPCDATMGRALRRYAPGDRIVVRVRGDRIVSVHTPLTPPPTTETKPTRRKATKQAANKQPKVPEEPVVVTSNQVYLDGLREQNRRRGERRRAETAPDEAANAVARLRQTSASSVFTPVNDLNTETLESELTSMRIKKSDHAAGCAFNIKLSSFDVEDAITAATQRLGRKPARYCIHRGMLYLSLA